MIMVDGFSIHLGKNFAESFSQMTLVPKRASGHRLYSVLCSGQFVGFVQAIDQFSVYEA